jgi:hypothetical protein
MVVCLPSSCGSGPVDAREIVQLVPEGDWRAMERSEIPRAGDAWNQEFGTRLQMDEPDDAASSAVPILMTDEGCMNARFQRTHAQAEVSPPEIRVCPETASNLELLFETIRHELGHVLGIKRHAKNSSAVMAPLSTEPFHWFQAEDRELFFSANPDF